jgi:hypothetical protein
MKLENYVIDESKSVHVSWWAVLFDVSEQELLAAIGHVGNNAAAVRMYFDEQQHRRIAQSHAAVATE